MDNLLNSAIFNKGWNMRQIQCLIVLSDTLHFGRAAKVLNMSQPALSRQIQSMEKYFGLNLLLRNSHRVELTAVGQTLVQSCRVAITELQKGLSRAEQLQKGLTGELRLGYNDFSMGTELPNILARYATNNPGTTLHTFQGSTTDLLNFLHEHQIDIALITGGFDADIFEGCEIARCKFVALLPNNHRFADKPTIRLAELGDEKLILGNEPNWKHYLRYLRRAFAIADIEPDIIARAFNSEGILGLVSAGLGISIYPDCIANHCRKGIVMKPISDTNVTIPISAIWNRDQQHEPLRLMQESLVFIANIARKRP